MVGMGAVSFAVIEASLSRNPFNLWALKAGPRGVCVCPFPGHVQWGQRRHLRPSPSVAPGTLGHHSRPRPSLPPSRGAASVSWAQVSEAGTWTARTQGSVGLTPASSPSQRPLTTSLLWSPLPAPQGAEQPEVGYLLSSHTACPCAWPPRLLAPQQLGGHREYAVGLLPRCLGRPVAAVMGI